MGDRFSLRLWAARFFFLFVLLFPKRRSADRRDEACRSGFGFPWSDVVFQSDPPTTFAAFDATIPIAEPTVRATRVDHGLVCATRLVTLRGSKTCGSIDSPPFPPLRTGDHVLDRECGFALRII